MARKEHKVVIPPPVPEDTAWEKELQDTLTYAVACHSKKFRKHSGLPYMVHPLQVLAMINKWGIRDHDVWKAAICHDVLEDCQDTNYATMAAYIGEKAANIVQELTFLPDPENPLEESQQKQIYLEGFMNRSLDALVIKVADRCCNTLDFLDYDPKYASKYWRKAKCVMDAMFSRGVSIIDRWGEGTFGLIKYSRDEVGQLCVR